MAVHEEPPRLCDFIRDNRQAILNSWTVAVRRLPVASELSQPRLIDHLPELLDRIAEVVRTVHEGGSTTLHGLPHVHAMDRLDRGFDLKAVVSEYALLRRCVLAMYEERYGPFIHIVEVQRFNDTIDAAIRDSAHYYTEQRHRVLAALDRLTTSSPAGAELHELLDRLLTVFVEASEVVDSSTILLREEDGGLRVRASIGLSDEVKHNWRVPLGQGFAGTIAATRQPMELRHAAEDPLVLSPYLKASGLRALYGVPLILNGKLLGVAHMGSRTAFEFAESDRALFRVLTTRAAVFIYENMIRDEAERRAAELEAVIDAIPGEVLIGDRLSGITHANAAALSLLGVSDVTELRDGLRGRAAMLNVRDADSGQPLTDDDLPVWRAIHGETVRTDLLLHHAGRDEDVTIRTVAAPFRMRGEVAGAVCICLDVSDRLALERERAELMRRLDEERERLLATLRQVPAGVVIADARTGRIVLSNEAASAIWRGGEAGDTMETYRPGRLFWTDGRAMTPADYPLQRALAGESVQQEIRLRRMDDTWATCLTSAAPVRSRDGTIVAAVAAFVDITERKTAEEQFRALADNIPQLAWVADGQGAIQWLNRRWQEYAGPNLAQMTGWGWQAALHPDHAERVGAKIARHVASGEVWEDTFPMRGTAGRYRWFLARAIPIRDDSGRVVRWFGTNTDVTEQRRLEEAREQFVAILGHDLRNPLNAIVVAAAVLGKLEREEAARKYVERITTSARRMQVMISDLLDFTRGRLGGGIVVEPKPADLAAISKSVIDEVCAAHPGSRITLDVRGTAEGTWDAGRLAQVVQNLVTNAIQHGDSAAEVRVVVDGHHADEVTLCVSNRGPTIPAELIPHLFEPFRRLAQGGEVGRTSLGLGLFIVSEIARAHGGRVSVRSNEDDGTVFEVRIPRVAKAKIQPSS
jgi:PAS domain S-box-containing protein